MEKDLTAPTLYHGLASTCSKKVRLCLYEKGIAFESRLLDLQKREQKEPAYLALNPMGVVPTLVDDGVVIRESSIILEYLDERFEGERLAPDAPAERARMRLLLRFSDQVAYPAIAAPTWRYMRDRAAETPLGAGSAPAPAARLSAAPPPFSDADLADAETRMDACLAELESALGDRLWLGGASFGLADCAVLPFAVRIGNLRPGLTTAEVRPAVAGWLARAARRPAFAKAIMFTDDPRASALPNI